MWTGELREWYTFNNSIRGRIYNSKGAWSGYDYPDGIHIGIDNLLFNRWGEEDIQWSNWFYFRKYHTIVDGWHFKLQSPNLRLKMKVSEEIQRCTCMTFNANNINTHKWWIYKFSEYAEGTDTSLYGKKPMDVKPEEEKEADILPFHPPKLDLITGGRDGGSDNWLLSLEEGAIFHSRNKKEPSPLLEQWHVQIKWGIGVVLHSNFPQPQEVTILVDSRVWSRQNEKVEVILKRKQELRYD